VSRAFEIFEEVDLVDSSYDTVVYDVLGDVVCGGFAAPMRRSAGSKVCIVLSEEMMAAYAANRIAAAISEFSDNGIVCAGLIVNLRNNRADLDPIKRLADCLGVQILGIVPRDPLVLEATCHALSRVWSPALGVPEARALELVERAALYGGLAAQSAAQTLRAAIHAGA
jgi:nitrogenase subunit NifH